MVAMSTVGWFSCWDETLPIGKLAHEPENPPRLSGKHGLFEDLRARSLESASPGKQARVDRRESDLLDQGGDPALRTPVVTGKENHESAFRWGGAPALRSKRVRLDRIERLHDAGIGEPLRDDVTGGATAQIDLLAVLGDRVHGVDDDLACDSLWLWKGVRIAERTGKHHDVAEPRRLLDGRLS